MNNGWCNKVGNESVTIFDEKDILEIVLKECSSDVYAWLQNYIDELKLQINESQKETNDLEEYFNNEIAEYEQDIKEYRKEIRELRMSDVRLP